MKQQTKVTPQQSEEIINLYVHQNLPCGEIKELLSLSSIDVVYNCLRRNNSFYKIKHTKESKKKMSVAAKARTDIRIHSEKTKKKLSQSKLAEKNPNFGKCTLAQQINLEKGREKIRNRTNEEKEIWSKKSSEIRKKAWEEGKYKDVINFGGNSKIHYFEGRVCKGLNELKFLKTNSEKHPEILNKVSSINTPFGNYTPDFELSEKYIELKSDLTYKCLLGICNYKGDKTKGNIKQLEKIKFVNALVKKVEIIVYYKSKYFSEVEFVETYKDEEVKSRFEKLR